MEGTRRKSVQIKLDVKLKKMSHKSKLQSSIKFQKQVSIICVPLTSALDHSLSLRMADFDRPYINDSLQSAIVSRAHLKLRRSVERV